MGASNIKSCKNCKYISVEGDDYSNWGYFNEFYVCDITNYYNLKSFPFVNTKCKKYKKNETN